METRTLNIGDKCTVKHHYGHTDTEKVMKIKSFEYNTGCQSGTAVTVNGLKWPVDSDLIIVIPKRLHWKTRKKIEKLR
jgi:hypothetical protein